MNGRGCLLCCVLAAMLALLPAEVLWGQVAPSPADLPADLPAGGPAVPAKSVGAAAPAASTEDDESEGPDPAGLPKPLDTLAGDLTGLEETGYFEIIDVQLGRTQWLTEEAVIWTVRVVKRIQCRHAMMLLERFRDVRFLRTGKQKNTELHLGRLYYSSWIESDAVNNRSLNLDEEFQLWLHLDADRVKRLKMGKADTVIFQPSRS